MNKFIDVHAHIEMLDVSEQELFELCQQTGVEQMITIGTHPTENLKVIDITLKHYPRIVCALGIHPHEAKHFNSQVESELEQQCSRAKAVAIGEIGLDYYYEHSDRATQKQAFNAQMALAQKLHLPVEIHTRDAEPDTLDILKAFPQVRGLIHCFTGSPQLARGCLDLGWDISFSGIVTFKKADALREVLKKVPLDRIHIETDSPFLAPQPFRGKKNNPSLLIHTADFVAGQLGISLEELSTATRANAKRLFQNLPDPSFH